MKHTCHSKGAQTVTSVHSVAPSGDNAGIAAAMQHVLRGVQQLPWPAIFPDLSPIEHVLDMMKWEFTLFAEPAITIARWKMLGTMYCRMTFISFVTICLRKYMSTLLPEGAMLRIDVTVWAPLTVMCVSFGLDLLYILLP